jgi:hypothetical protein
MKINLCVKYIFDGSKTDFIYSLDDLRQINENDINNIKIDIVSGKIVKRNFQSEEKITEKIEEVLKPNFNTCIKEFQNKNVVSSHNLDNGWAGEHVVFYKDNTFEYSIYGSGRPIVCIYVGTYEYM